MRSRPGVGLAFFLLAFLLLGVCFGCASHREAARPAVEKDNLGVSVVWTTHPTYPQQMDETHFFVQVTDTSRRPVTGAVVTLQLAMPAMEMGRNEVALHEMPPGTYTGTGRFSMPGEWQATVQVGKNGQNALKTISLKVQ